MNQRMKVPPFGPTPPAGAGSAVTSGVGDALAATPVEGAAPDAWAIWLGEGLVELPQAVPRIAATARPVSSVRGPDRVP